MGDVDYRSLVESAYNEAEATSGDSAGAVEQADAGGQSQDVSVAPEDGGADAAPTGEERTASDGRAEGRARDEKGKFAKTTQAKTEAPRQGALTKTKAGTTPAPSSTDGATPLPASGDSSQTQTPAPGATTEALRAPQSWTPSAREAFAKAPVEVQREVAKREREVAMAMQDAAPAKRFHQEMGQVFAPLEPLMRQRGITPQQAMASYANFDLQLSNPATAARAAAQLIQSYGIPVEHLASALDALGSQHAQQQQQSMDPRTIAHQVRQEVMQDFQRQREQSLVSKYEKETSDFFAGDGSEFGSHETFGPAIQSRIEGLLRADKTLGLKDAYEQAVWAHPGTRDILQKRAAADAAKAKQASMQQAQRAASSVKSAPGSAATPPKAAKNHRDMVAAVYESLE